MDLNNRVKRPEDRAEPHRREMHVEHRREPLLDGREHVVEVEESIEYNRIVSRTLIMLGVFLLIFAGFWLIYTGWDIRDGHRFVTGFMVISGVIGLVLAIAGAIKRNRQPELYRESMDRERERAA